MGRGKVHARSKLLCSEEEMILFSRAFIRKHMISLATTASVTATSFARAEDPARMHHPRRGMSIQYVADRPDHSEGQPFLSENAVAMKEMMADMTIEPTDYVDRDFVAMMVPHHQGTIGMAKAELKYGHNEQLRRLAQHIVAKQQQIRVMRDADGNASAVQSAEQPRAQMSARPAVIAGSISDGETKMSR
jgi:hypothetical protein